MSETNAPVSTEQILLAHGSGGLRSHQLVERTVATRLGARSLAPLDDAALLTMSLGKLAFTTDSYVVRPLFFPGGDLGRLAVCGTVNDLAVMGARPKHLSCALIIEEGLPLSTLEAVLDSMATAAREAGVDIVTGDTKVVERGAADSLFVTTAGVGTVPLGRVLGLQKICPGDKLLLTGTLADHGAAVLAQREEFAFDSPLESDCAPLNGLIDELLDQCPGVRFLRDPTRGGLATTLNEIADGTGLTVTLDERALPVRESVAAFCEVLGLDPLYVANEGKALIVVAPDQAELALECLRNHPLGQAAEAIGELSEGPRPSVRLRTAIGGSRLVEMLAGEALPRIC